MGGMTCCGEGIGGMTGGSPLMSSVGYVRLRVTELGVLGAFGLFVCVDGERRGVFDIEDARERIAGERASGMVGVVLGGDCEVLETRGYVWLLPRSRGLFFEGVGPPTRRGLSNPAGSSEKVVRNTLDAADVGGVVSTVNVDMALDTGARDDSRLDAVGLLVVDAVVPDEPFRLPGAGVGGP